MLNVKTVRETREIISRGFSVLRTRSERVTLLDALGRVLSDDVISGEQVPGFNRSTMDGYAVKASDTFGASESIPAILEIKGEVFMGESKIPLPIKNGQCARIPTGGELPEGCDAVVMFEDTEDVGDGFCYVNKAVAPGGNIIFAGDDIKNGQTVLRKGKRLTPPDIGTLAALGITEADVYAKPVVGIISSGDEIVPISQTPNASQVRDVNAYTTATGVIQAGGVPLTLGICPDDADILKKTVAQGLTKCDMLIISGGSSAGERDVTLQVIKELGGEILIHGIAIKPGKPTILGLLGGLPVWGLPGHPAGAYFVFHLIVEPMIYSMSGMETQPMELEAVLTETLPSNHGREEYIPVRLEQIGGGVLPEAAPIAFKSGLISRLSDASGYIRIPRDCEGIAAGEKVNVVLF